MISLLGIPRASSGALAVAALAMLPACERLVPQTDNGTIGLLKVGSEKVCVAPDVQQSLHDLIIPKVADVKGGNGTDEKLHAINSVSLSYSMTTLQSFDKEVARASCSTTVRVGGGDRSSKFTIAYQVSPSAENAASFVVTADADNAHAFANDLIGDAIDDETAKNYVAQQDADEAQARAKLLATVTAKWLVGSWIAPGEDPAHCADGSALVFGADRRDYQDFRVWAGG